MAVVILDGGLSTALEELDVDISGPLWTARAVLENQDELAHAHRRFSRAGADYVTTASYQSGVEHFESLGMSALQARSALLSTTSIARVGVEGSSALVAASVGPYGASLADGSEYNGQYRSSTSAIESYHSRKLDVLCESNPDAFAVETQLLADEVRVIAEHLVRLGSPRAWFSFGFRDERTTYGGDSLERVISAIADYPNLIAVGLNCTAPHLVTPVLVRMADFLPGVDLIAYPNHGGEWHATDRSWSQPVDSVFELTRIQEWHEVGARIIGGCCGIGPLDIAQLAKIARSL